MRIGTPTFMPASEYEYAPPPPPTLIMERPHLAPKPLKSPLWARVCLGAGLAVLVVLAVLYGVAAVMLPW